MLQDEGGIYIFELRKNPGLKANVISMYKSHFQREGFFRPMIAENVTISGKLKEHTVDIYFEFIQMNNLERTVIKVIEGTKVTENDMWEFANVLKDLHFFAKGIIYYDDRVSSGAKKVAELTNIDLKKFDLLDEVRKSALSAVKVMLPDEEIIGDPFWTVMETEQDSDKNTGNYEMVNDSILLFLPPDVLEEKQVDTQYISSQLDVIYEDENILIANNSQRTLEGIDSNRYITYINNSIIHYLSPSLGSNTLRKPSPRNAKPSMVILIATAGKINWNG